MHSRKRLLGRRNRLLHIFLSMRSSHKRRLELRWRKINSVLQHRPEEISERLGVAFLGRSPVRDRPWREEPGKHRTDAVAAHHYSRVFGCGGYACDHFTGKLVELGVNIPVLAQIAERCVSR